jgi:hypothetical protein
MMFNPDTATYAKYYLDTFRSAASALAIEPIEVPVRSAAEAEPFITKLGGETGAGLVVMPETSTALYRPTIITLVARHRLPAIYPFRFFVTNGGLLSYGMDLADSFRGAANCVDRILKGAKPSELAGQLPIRFELIVNLKTAKAIGLSIPPTLIVRADEVIEQRPVAFRTKTGSRLVIQGEHRSRYFNCVEIELNVVLSFVPRPFTTAMMAMEIPAAIRPYSMAVAPDSSLGRTVAPARSSMSAGSGALNAWGYAAEIVSTTSARACGPATRTRG